MEKPVSTEEELAEKIINYFLHLGATVSKKDYDFIVKLLDENYI